MPSLGVLSSMTLGTEAKSHSTLQRVSFADMAPGSLATPNHPQHKLSRGSLDQHRSSWREGPGPLTARKMALMREDSRPHPLPKARHIHHSKKPHL